MTEVSDQNPTEKPLITDAPSNADKQTGKESIAEPGKSGQELLTGNDRRKDDKRELLKG